MSRNDTYPYEAVLRLRGEAALMVEINGDLHWLPYSVVGRHDAAKIGDTLELHIPEWLLEARGIY